MRTMKWVLVAFMVVLALGFAAEAGGKGALKFSLYEGTYNADLDRVVLPRNPADWVESGHVLITSTGNGKAEITVKLETDDPNAANKTFDVSVRRPSEWGPGDEQLTSNNQGRGTLHLRRDVPDVDPLRFKVHLVTGDKAIAFATEFLLIELK